MSARTIRILDEAAKDLELGKLFYAGQGQAIGAYFSSSLLSDIRSLRLYAGIHPAHFGYFRMLASRFPFAIYYEIKGETAVVVAVLDMRHNPRSIRYTLEQRSGPQKPPSETL